MPQLGVSNVITRDGYADLLDKSMDLVWLRKDRFKGNLSQFFDYTKAKNGAEYKISSVGQTLSMPKVNEDTEALPYVKPADGFDKSFTFINYRMAIKVTENAMKTDRFSKISGMMGGLVKASMRKQEYLKADIFNNAFTGTAGADSLSLCNDSHTNPAQGTGTWDNLGTGALTQGNLQALRLLARQQVNDRGNPDEVIVKQLLVPPALEQKALELTTATLMPENALNQPNVLITSIKPVVSNYLSSATAYFLIGDLTGEEKGLHEVMLIPIKKLRNSPVDATTVFDTQVKFFGAYGFTVSKNIYGSTGA